MLDPDDKRDIRDKAKHLLNSSPHRHFRTSILAIGEVFGRMAETRSANASAEAAAALSLLVRRDRVELFGIGRDSRAIDLASQLMSSDRLISPTDALLVACALEDDDCVIFATEDRRLVENSSLRTQASAHGVSIMNSIDAVGKRGSAHLGTAFKQLETPEGEPVIVGS
jgi:predicted nucleic acid-binding protein